MLGDVLVEDGQGDVAQQGRQDPTLRGAAAGVPFDAILAEDARLQECLDQCQDGLSPTRRRTRASSAAWSISSSTR
jgi:hypothetical protein